VDTDGGFMALCWTLSTAGSHTLLDCVSIGHLSLVWSQLLLAAEIWEDWFSIGVCF
jgi:hypothetical protein